MWLHEYLFVMTLPNLFLKYVALHYNSSCLPDSIQMGVLTEIWSGLSDGEHVNESLECTPTYPDKPDSQIQVASFEFAGNLSIKSGVRSRAYFSCATSGRHTFSIKCDDQCRFTVKEDKDFSESLGYHDAIYSPSYQDLWSLYLTEGKLYFLEVLHVQKKDGGYFALGVTLPNGTVIRPITMEHLVMYIPDCRGEALGMESGTISNGQIRASSEYAAHLAASCGRLHLQLGGCHGSWAAADRDVNQWLQVDLVNQHTTVTGVATQGRTENNQWVKTYRLQYGNNGELQDYKQQGETTIKVFTGNTDENTVVSHDLNPPIMTRYIRFLPVTWKDHISMRVELYGCQEFVRTLAEPGPWGGWSDCSVKCGNGLQSRWRPTCTNPPTGIFQGLDPAFNLNETKPCSMNPCPECFPDWSLFMDSCYKVHTSPNTWDVAVQKCLDLNSKLVVITNSGENVFVTNLLAAAGFHRAWIGLSDRQQENLFVWTDGSSNAFTNWGTIEPNGNTSENCVFIDSNNSRWADVACNDSYTSICEKKAHDDTAQCSNAPIGMESGSIPDQAITVNNTYSGYSGRKGRLGHSHTAWCGNDARIGYLQIALQHLYRICAVATQGGGNFFFTQYVLQLSADGSTWDFYKENGILKVFDGNVNHYAVKKNTLKRGVASSKLRFFYLSARYYNLLPCIRAEIYGFREIEPSEPLQPPTMRLMWFRKRKSISAAWGPIFTYYSYGTIQGYHVKYYEDGSREQAKTLRTVNAFIHIEGLKDYTSYCISVSAINEHGIGKGANNSKCLKTDEGVPTTPPNVTAYNTSSSSFRVDWLPLTQEFVPGILTGYRVRYRQPPNIFTGEVFVSIDQPTSWEYRGLDIHTQYCVQMLGETKHGIGPECYDGCVNVTTDVGPPSMPPPNITAYNTSSTSLEITWQVVPEEFAKAPILGFKLFYRKADESNVTKVDLCPEERRFCLHNLTIFTVYCIQLSAFTRNGNGNMSDCVFGLTDEGVPSSPPANLTAYNTSSTSIRVSWDPVPTAFRQGFILGYRVYLIGTQAQLEQHLRRRKRTSMPTGNEIFMDTTNLTTEFQGLEKYSNYCVQGVAYTRIGESNRTNATCVSTDEDIPTKAPANLTGHNTSSVSLLIKWGTIPPEYIHGILIGYKIFYVRTSGSNIPYETLTVSPETLTTELTGLLKNTEYCVRVAGFTRRGDGNLTDCLNIATDHDFRSAAPYPVTASFHESPHKITFTWQPLLQSELNGQLLGYKVEYQMVALGGVKLGTSSELLTEIVPPEENGFLLINQSVYTMFRFKVAAMTTAGQGNFSEEVTGETCRCEKTVTTAITPSPLDKDGVLSGIISDVIKESCGNCQEHGETELVFEQSSEQGNTEPDLKFPVTAASVRGSQYSKYLPVLEVPGMLVIERNEGAQSEVYQKVVTSSILDNWPILVLAILTMVLAGIIIWILDSPSNHDDFPRSFIKGAGEGFWWAFITMTTVGYGDRCPKGVVARVFAIVWFVVGFIIYTFFGAAVAAIMTVTVVNGGPTLQQKENKISAVTNSTEYSIAAKSLNGKWDIGKTYDTAEELVDALKSGETDAIFVDMYLPSKRSDLFNGTWFKVAQLVEVDISHGIVLRGEAIKMHKALKDFIAQNNVQSNYLSSGDKGTAPVHSEEATFFEINSPYFMVTMTAVGSLLFCAIVCGLTYDILRRIKEKKQGKLDFINRDKDALAYELREVVERFRESFLARMTSIKRKHKKQLQLVKPLDQIITTRL